MRMMTSAPIFELIKLPAGGDFLPWGHARNARRAVERVRSLSERTRPPPGAGGGADVNMAR
jgi:hypothetical protein